MALRKVGVIFTAEGHAQYMNQLKQTNQEMRTLATQSKLAVAQLGNNASITDTYSTKMKSMGALLDVARNRTTMLKDQQKILGDEQKRLPGMIDNATSSYKASNSTTKELRKTYTELAEAKGEDAKETLEAEKAYKASLRETNKLKKEMKELEVVYVQNGKELEKLPNNIAKAGLATQKLSNETQRLHDIYRNQGGALADVAMGVQNFSDRAGVLSDNLKNYGSTLTRNVTAPIVAIGGFAVKSAMDWESSFAGVMKTNDEVFNSTGQLIYGYSDLEAELRNLTTTIPIAHGELANIAENAGQLGIATQDVVGFTEVIAQLGHTTNLSYDEASTALAQFLNVTGSGTNTVSNLASSIVALGNNTAATEKDILMMSQRWATTGAMIGLTDDQITAMSASLISMGVNVEAGGSALQRFGQKINSHVLDAGDELTLLAETAGMTASEFATAWENEPMTAIESFLEGLDGVVKEGGNANQLLKDLGITSVNELNALLALAGGHEQLADALGLSATAYKENTALIDEFGVFADTTASKVQLFWNTIKDLAITLGGPLMDALNSGLEAVDPWIQKLGDAANEFANMDEEGQRAILMWTGIAAAAGPTLSILGSAVGIVSNLSGGFATLIRTLGKWATPKALGGTVLSLTKLSPLLPIVAVGATTLGAAYLYLNSEAKKANDRLEEFPNITDVTEAQAKSLRRVADNVNAVAVEMEVLDSNTDLSNATGHISSLASEVKTLNDERITQLRDNFSKLPQDVQASLQNSLDATIANIEAQTDRVDEVVNRISEIAEAGYDEQGILRGEYVQEMKSLSDELMSYYSFSLSENADQQVQIYESLTKDITQMNREELATRGQAVVDAVRAEEALYEEQKQSYFEMKQALGLSDEEYRAGQNRLERAHQTRMTALRNEEIQTRAEMQKREMQEILESTGHMFDESSVEYQAFLKSLADEYGITLAEIKSIIEDVDLTEPIKRMADASGPIFDQLGENFKPVVKEAISEWNTSINQFSEAIGKVASELSNVEVENFIKQSRDAGMTWEQLQFVAKFANIDDNTREAINNAAEAQGGWDAVIFAEKNAEVNVMGMDELQALIEMFGVDFASLTDEQKEAMINANGAKELSDLMVEYGIWKADSPAEAKRAAVDADPALSAFKELFIAQGWWEDATFPGKIADVDTNKEDFMDDLAQIISEWSGIPVDEVKQMLIETNAGEKANEVNEFNDAVGAASPETSSTFHASAGSAGEKADEVGKWNTNISETPESKSSGIETNVFSILANTIAVLGYNVAVGAMTDKTSTLTTAVPGIVTNTLLVHGWNNAMANSYSKTSTLTTVHRTVRENVGFATGGHIDAYAEGGQIQFAGAFASGGNVPKGYSGIVGEAGAEIFTVTDRGVSITPLNSREKMRGVGGAVETEVARQLGDRGTGGDTVYNIEINHPVVKDKQDIRTLAREVDRELGKQIHARMRGRARW